MFLIIAHLRTSIRMWESNDRINAFRLKCFGFFGNERCNVVDTANGGDDPDFVSNTGFSIGSSVPVKKTFFCGFQKRMLFLVGIVQKIPKSGLHIMCVNPGSCRNVLSGIPDGGAIFDHSFTGADFFQGKFMSLRNIFQQSVHTSIQIQYAVLF